MIAIYFSDITVYNCKIHVCQSFMQNQRLFLVTVSMISGNVTLCVSPVFMATTVRETNSFITISNGLAVKALDSQSRVPCSKPLGGSKVDSAFHPSEVDKMSTRNFYELSGKK